MGTNHAVTTTVTVLIRPEKDGLHAHSPDVPGLHVWGATDEDVCVRIKSGIELLYKLNYQRTVVATLAADRKTFSRPPMRASNHFLVSAAHQ